MFWTSNQQFGTIQCPFRAQQLPLGKLSEVSLLLCPTILTQAGAVIGVNTVWQWQLVSVSGRKWHRDEKSWIWPPVWLASPVWALRSERYHLPHYWLWDDSYITSWHFQPEPVRTKKKKPSISGILCLGYFTLDENFFAISCDNCTYKSDLPWLPISLTFGL